jgi:competence protein ComEC
VLEWLAGQPGAIWHVPHLPIPELAALACGPFLLLAPGVWMTRWVALLLCLPAAFYRPETPSLGDFEVAVLDVGQGLSTVVRTHLHVLVYDTGPAFQSGRDAGEQVLLPYLRYYGVRAVDALIVSHGDLDHRGGMVTLMTSLPVRVTMAGPSVVLPNGTGKRCIRGQVWTWDEVRFEVLHPRTVTGEADNDSSCVLRISSSAGSALLTGDIESEGEQALVEAGLQQTQVVVAPHHGSRSSSTVPFVAAVGANLVVFSAGYRNRWGFPREDVVRRWRDAGARTLVTSTSGAIEISLDSGQPRAIREYRREHRRYWHR